MRSFSGCWTCRLRRKKCDENHPLCDACAALHITCYYDQDKPEWMDGGVRQKEITERLKREVRGKAHRHRGQRAVRGSGDCVPGAEAPTGKPVAQPQEPPCYLATPVTDLLTATPDSSHKGHNDAMGQSADVPTLWPRLEADGILDYREACGGVASGWPDACLVMCFTSKISFPSSSLSIAPLSSKAADRGSWTC